MVPTCYILHVQHCVVGCSRLLGLCFFGMAALHFFLISLVNRVSIGHFFFVVGSLLMMVDACASLLVCYQLGLLNTNYRGCGYEGHDG